MVRLNTKSSEPMKTGRAAKGEPKASGNAQKPKSAKKGKAKKNAANQYGRRIDRSRRPNESLTCPRKGAFLCASVQVHFYRMKGADQAWAARR